MTVRDHTAFINASQEQADILEPNEGDLVSALKDVRDTRDQRDKLKADLESKEAPLRAYFEKHPEARLFDGEHGIEGFSQFGGHSTVYDVPKAIKSRAPALYKRLKELNCITETLDVAATEEAIKSGLLSAGDLKPFKHQKEKSRSLQVKLVAEGK